MPPENYSVRFFHERGVSRQLANAQVAEFNRGSFRLKAEIAEGGFAAGAARYFLAIYPQAYFTVDGSNVIVVPLPYPFAQIFTRETPHPVPRRKGRHLRLFRRKHIAMRREPVGLLFVLALILFCVTVIQHLDFDAFRKGTGPRFQVF